MTNDDLMELYYDIGDDNFKINHLIGSSIRRKKYSFERAIRTNKKHHLEYKVISTSLIIEVSDDCFVIYEFEEVEDKFKMVTLDVWGVNEYNYSLWGLSKKDNKVIPLMNEISEDVEKLLENTLNKEVKRLNRKEKLNKFVKYFTPS